VHRYVTELSGNTNDERHLIKESNNIIAYKLKFNPQGQVTVYSIINLTLLTNI